MKKGTALVPLLCSENPHTIGMRIFSDRFIRLSLALLICNGTGCLTSRLTRCLTLTAAALSSCCLQICLIDGLDMFHMESLPNRWIISSILTQIHAFFNSLCYKIQNFYILHNFISSYRQAFSIIFHYRGGLCTRVFTPHTPPIQLQSKIRISFIHVPAPQKLRSSSSPKKNTIK